MLDSMMANECSAEELRMIERNLESEVNIGTCTCNQLAAKFLDSFGADSVPLYLKLSPCIVSSSVQQLPEVVGAAKLRGEE